MTGLKALNVARTQLGVKETSPNWGVRVSKYLASVGINFPAPWCLAFVHWCFHEVGKELTGHGLVQSFVNWAEKNGEIVARPFAGDVVCYDWNADDWYDHAGIVEKVLALRWRNHVFAGWIQTIEGNTSPVFGGVDGVYRRRRWVGHCKFVRIK